jgi:integrase
MRYSGQYSLRWEDVGLTRKQITLQKTKAGKRQIVRLNASAIRALEKLGPKTSGPVCPDDSWAHRVWWKPCSSRRRSSTSTGTTCASMPTPRLCRM